jgi:2-C-methyl-D-erythritol 4-phosphate cytidylyltransferase
VTESGLVIVAAGKGDRLGSSEEKALVPLLGHPILAWTLQAFEEFDEIVERVVVVPPGREQVFRERVIDPLHLPHEVRLVPGGAERQDSVALGMAALTDRPHWVMIHDAARPLVGKALVRSILETLDGGESVVPALPLRDSVVRKGYEQWIKEYESREELLSVQTPQGFHRPVLQYAHEQAVEHGYRGTDEASLLVHMNHPVSWIPGDPENLKITHPGDLLLAEAILRARGFREGGAA